MTKPLEQELRELATYLISTSASQHCARANACNRAAAIVAAAREHVEDARYATSIDNKQAGFMAQTGNFLRDALEAT